MLSSFRLFLQPWKSEFYLFKIISDFVVVTKAVHVKSKSAKKKFFFNPSTKMNKGMKEMPSMSFELQPPLFYFLILTKDTLSTDLQRVWKGGRREREKERGREGSICVREIHRLVASHTGLCVGAPTTEPKRAGPNLHSSLCFL